MMSATLCILSILAFDMAVGLPDGSGFVPMDLTDQVQRVRPTPDFVVPSREYPTIQEAIDAAEDGDHIRIRPGVYEETLMIVGKRVHIAGAGPRGAKRTELRGPIPTDVSDAADAVGLVNYWDGGGVLEGIRLTGGENGIVSHDMADPPRDTPTDDDSGEERPTVCPALASSLQIRNVVISDTGRGVSWQASSDLTIRDSQVSNTLWHGIVFGSRLRDLRRPSGRVRIFNVKVIYTGHFGVFVVDTPSEGCQNQLVNVEVAYASSGGIVVLNSGVCIYDSTLSLNNLAGIRAEKSAVYIDGTRLQFTLPVEGTETFGDGVMAMLSEVTMVNSWIHFNHRAGISVFGGKGILGWDTFNCNAWDVEFETLPADFFGPGDPPVATPGSVVPIFGNEKGGCVCGCGVVLTEENCSAVTVSHEPPGPIGDIE